MTLLASLRRWGCSSLHFVAGGAPRFAQSLGVLLASLRRFPFNGSIELLQNLHSRGPTEQHFYVLEPYCGCLHEVKKWSRTPMPTNCSTIYKNGLVPPSPIPLNISKHLRFCWQQLFGPLRNITISLKSIRPNKTEIKIIAEKNV